VNREYGRILKVANLIDMNPRLLRAMVAATTAQDNIDP
jgi:hypothetical protein